MPLFGEAEVLLHVGIEHEPGGSGHRVSRGISELIDGLESESGGIEPALGGRRIETDVLAGGIRTVGIDVGVGAIDACARIDVKSGAPRGDSADLPSADYAIEHTIPNLHFPALAERHIVQP